MAKKDDEKKADAEDEGADKKKAEGEEGEAAEGGEAGADGKPKFKLSKKMLIIVIAAAVLVLGGGVGAFFMLGKHDSGDKTAKEESKETGEATFFPLGDMLVNLSGEGKHPNYLKIKVSLELADKKDVAMMETLKPRIIDNFQVYLRELRIEDLRGSAGLYRLREELLLRVTEAAAPIRVKDVLFQEMLVQ